MIGIYQILNKVNLKRYDGSSLNVCKRLYRHKYLLRNNKHQNLYLQNAWNKYGEENFEFKILKECLKEELKYWEEYYIILDESYKREKGYNIERYSNGYKLISIETRRKIGKGNKGKYVSRETRQKLREKLSGENNPMYGISPWNKGKKRLDHSILMSGKNNPMFGKKHSKETKQKISEIRKKKYYGENHPNSKLTLEQVKEIREKYIPRKYTMKILSIEYNVAIITIQKIIQNKIWKEDF